MKRWGKIVRYLIIPLAIVSLTIAGVALYMDLRCGKASETYNELTSLSEEQLTLLFEQIEELAFEGIFSTQTIDFPDGGNPLNNLEPMEYRPKNGVILFDDCFDRTFYLVFDGFQQTKQTVSLVHPSIEGDGSRLLWIRYNSE